MEYLLQYYDQLLLETLRPEKVVGIAPDHVEKIAATASLEKRKITMDIIGFIFSLKKEQTARLHLTTYHATIRSLQKICLQYSEHPVYTRNQALKKLIQSVSEAISYLSGFMEQRFRSYIMDRQDKPESCSDLSKIQTSLSIDQLSILFRAAFDEKFIQASSLNSLFNIVVPFLATRDRNNLSANSMRSKSYTAETRDKDITIDILQKIIGRIDDY